MLHASATFAALAATSQGSLSTLLKVEGMGSGYMLAGCVGAMEAVIQAKRGSYGMIWPCIIVYESFLEPSRLYNGASVANGQASSSQAYAR